MPAACVTVANATPRSRRAERVPQSSAKPADGASNATGRPANDVHTVTFGFNYYPIDQLVLKTSFLRVRNEARTGQNEFQIGLGYVF